MNEKFILLITFLIFGLNTSFAQKSKTIEKLEFENYELKVIFLNPYENLVSENPEFKNLDSLKQEQVWNKYILNNVIYDFQLIQKKKIIKHYLLKGNPSKNIYPKNLTRNNVYLLDIVNHKNNTNFYRLSEYSKLIDKTIDKLSFYGTLFGNMELLKDNEGKLGKNLFGRFRLNIPYSTIKNNVMNLIGSDLFGEIETEWIANNTDEFKNSFFDYQEKIDQYFKIERIKKIFVRTYDQNGNIQNEYPRLNTDKDIKSYIGKMNRIGDVVSLPFFKSTDKTVLIEKDNSTSKYKVELTNNEPVEKYLENIVVSKNSNGEIENITATLLLHGSSIDRGDYIDRENYIAYFKTFKDMRLPFKILYSPLTDIEFEKPRIEIELDYLFHKK
ncbi:hypothetical protein [Aquimarina latercula]|uniref:hypothetical protein n=1 Tax=Aquimarina latercula TaxID=987 RepID=UPI0004022D67|nr:hypothetical protein [Aquimarina latercula]